MLSNPEKRDIYDRFGEKGLKEGAGGGGDPFDIFDLLKGGGHRQRGPVKAKAKMIPLKCTLEEVYKGILKKVKHTRKRPCSACEGKGGKEVKKCGKCKGKGIAQKII